MKTVADLVERMQTLHLRTAETPLFNPVFQLSLDLSRAIESGELSLGGIEMMVAELECTALMSRAERLRCLVDPQQATASLDALIGEDEAFDDFAARWSRPQLHAVFTAHPTFLLGPAQSNAVAQAASGRPNGDDAAVCTIPGDRPPFTLNYEHRQAMVALANAQDARDRIVSAVLARAQTDWPDRWRDLKALPFRFATWVGYDMDGRTDIGWHTSVGFRLAEKAERLARYAASLAAIDDGHPLVAALQRASGYAAERAADFAADLDGPNELSAAANRLTADHAEQLLSLAPLIDQLEGDAGEADTAGRAERAVALRTLSAAMRVDGLGMGWIHFRVNASQLHNAIRRRLPDDHAIDLASRGAIVTLRELLCAGHSAKI